MDESHCQALTIARELLLRPAGSADSADIADRMGLTREEAAQIVKDLEAGGYVTVWPEAASGPTWTIMGLSIRGQGAVRECASVAASSTAAQYSNRPDQQRPRWLKSTEIGQICPNLGS